jgi:hypothetical protein
LPFFVLREFDDRQPITASSIRIAQLPTVADPVPVSSQPI